MSMVLFAIALLSLSISIAAPSIAQEEPAARTEPTARTTPVALTAAQEARALALESELRCPVCRSQSIRQSRSFMAEDMKRRLRALIAAGRTDDQIRDYFVARYGAWILLTPPKSGFNLVAFLPWVLVLAGAAAVVVAVRRWNGGGEPVPPPDRPAAGTPLELARLEREIEESGS